MPSPGPAASGMSIGRSWMIPRPGGSFRRSCSRTRSGGCFTVRQRNDVQAAAIDDRLERPEVVARRRHVERPEGESRRGGVQRRRRADRRLGDVDAGHPQSPRRQPGIAVSQPAPHVEAAVAGLHPARLEGVDEMPRHGLESPVVSGRARPVALPGMVFAAREQSENPGAKSNQPRPPRPRDSFRCPSRRRQPRPDRDRESAPLSPCACGSRGSQAGVRGAKT